MDPKVRSCLWGPVNLRKLQSPFAETLRERAAPVIYRNAQHTFGDDNKGGISTHATINEHILPY